MDIIKRCKGNRCDFVSDPTGRENIYKWSRWLCDPQLWVSFKDVENEDVIGRGWGTWGNESFERGSERMLYTWFDEERISDMGEEAGAGV